MEKVLAIRSNEIKDGFNLILNNFFMGSLSEFNSWAEEYLHIEVKPDTSSVNEEIKTNRSMKENDLMNILGHIQSPTIAKG